MGEGFLYVFTLSSMLGTEKMSTVISLLIMTQAQNSMTHLDLNYSNKYPIFKYNHVGFEISTYGFWRNTAQSTKIKICKQSV